ncbi:MAG: Asp-tRNA(Asn)/Glu-tRNA(Gln) amidotransferase subunit GatB [Patescibacteria group bacterium]
MSDYLPTIGLEIHVELKTRTKMFCDSPNDPDEKEPNVNICPICMGHPGTLPTINKEAVKHVLKVGIAVGGEIADFTEFDRKNYFYPDIPKGYQISQYAYPLVKGGSLHGIALTRVHLEEDTARSQHMGEHSLIDFNRAGVPLMELVTEPVIHSAKEAGDFARELQLLLRYLGVSDADMEKGHMRLEANISVSKDPKKLGVKTEVKNINSFTFAEKAIEYEIKRQIAALEAGEEVVQETRGWNVNKGETYSQRKKESSHDYRYFPEPDLPKLKISEISEFSKENLEKEMPELPEVERINLRKYELTEEDIETLVHSMEEYKSISKDKDRMNFLTFAKLVAKSDVLSDDKEKIKVAISFITNNLIALKDGQMFNIPDWNEFAEAVLMKINNELSAPGLKEVVAAMAGGRASHPRELAKELGVLQQSDEGTLAKIVEKVITENPTVVADYKAGKENLLQFLVGQGMKESKGSANPKVLADLFKKGLV